MTAVLLSVAIEADGSYVRVEREQSESWAQTASHSVRSSPIFPVTPSVARLPETENFWIGFFYYQQAFLTIGEAVAELDDQRQSELWYSHGLATPIIIASDISVIEGFERDYQSRLRAIEIWEVRAGVLVRSSTRLSPAMKIDPKALSLVACASFDADTRSLVSQLQQSLMTAAAAAAQFAPRDIGVFAEVVHAANETISELAFLIQQSGTPPLSVSRDVVQAILTDSVQRQQRIHQRIGDLVQLNSTLSYVISQSYSGRPPILLHPSPFISYQLLGVGTAARALSALCRFVESRFAEHSICSTIDTKYRLLPPVEEFVNLQNFDPGKWRDFARKEKLDFHFDSAAPEVVKPRLLYFSSRLGFRESEFTLTAAAQVLELSCTARWNLITMSHELIHAHVRAILAAIFAGTAETCTSSEFARFCDIFAQARDGDHAGLHLIDSLRNAIFSYAKHRQPARRLAKAASATTKSRLRDSVPKSDAASLRDCLTGSFRILNEIIVHTLDYYYFYNGSTSTYVTLLWQSWATVPAVLEHLDEYLLRTLIPVSTKFHGNTNERLTQSIAETKGAIEAIVTSTPTNGVAAAALARLSEPRAREEFVPEFLFGSYLAELTRHFLLSAVMQAALREGDDNVDVDSDGDEWTYSLDSLTFPGFTVTSPVAFLIDRLVRASRGENTGVDEEALSAWTLLACASAEVSI